MKSIDTIIEELRFRNCEKVAKSTGLSGHIVRQIRAGARKATAEEQRALSDYLERGGREDV